MDYNNVSHRNLDRGGKVSSETRMRWDSTPHHKNHGQYEVITRILLTNEPRSYREAMAGAFRALKPHTEVFVAEPEALDAEVARLSPQLVVCSHASPTVKIEALGWVELYPGHGSLSTVSVGGQRSTVVGIELADLLRTIDRTEALARSG